MLDRFKADDRIITAMEQFKLNSHVAYITYMKANFDSIVNQYIPYYRGVDGKELQNHVFKIYTAMELLAMRTITCAMDVTVRGQVHTNSLTKQYMFDAFVGSNMNEIEFVEHCILRSTQSVVSSLLWRLPQEHLLSQYTELNNFFGECLSDEISVICQILNDTDLTAADNTNNVDEMFNRLINDPVAFCIKRMESEFSLGEHTTGVPLRCRDAAVFAFPYINKRLQSIPDINLCFIPQLILENYK